MNRGSLARVFYVNKPFFRWRIWGKWSNPVKRVNIFQLDFFFFFILGL